MTTIFKIITLIIVSFIPLSIGAQPSYSMEFAFVLYDKHGKKVKPDALCSTWQLIGNNGRSVSPCGMEYFNNEFHIKNGSYYTVAVHTVVRPYVLSLIHRKDTMTLIVSAGYPLLFIKHLQ